MIDHDAQVLLHIINQHNVREDNGLPLMYLFHIASLFSCDTTLGLTTAD